MKTSKRAKPARQPEPARVAAFPITGAGVSAGGLEEASASAACLASIVQASQDAIASFSPEGIVQSWNPAAEQLFGYTASEMIGKHVSVLAPPDRTGEVERILKLGASGKRVPPFETVRRRKDGSFVDVDVSRSPIFQGGRLIAVAAIWRDISERKRTEESLRKHASLLSLVQDGARMGVFEWDLVTNRAYWTCEMQELMGLELDDRPANLEPWFAAMHPEDRLRLEQAFDEWVGSKRQDATLQYRFSGNGGERWMEIRGRMIRDSGGRPLKMIGMNLDITERKQAEVEIREGRERLRAILENSLDAAYRRNLQGDGYDYVSPVIEQITGWTPEELGSQALDTVLKWIHPADVRHVERTLKKAMAGGQPCRRLEYRFRCKDGSYRWLAESFRVIRDEAGRPMHLVGIVRDVSDRKQMEEALRESQRLARSTFEAIPAQIAVIDETGAILDVNKAWRRFARANGGTDEATGRGVNYLKVCDNVHGMGRRDAARFAAGIRSVLCGRRAVFSMEYPCHSPGGRRWFTGYVTPFAGEGDRRAVVAHVNITVVKLAEEKFRDVLESAPDAMVIVDGGGRIQMVNRQTEEMFRYTRRELIGRKLEMLVPSRLRRRHVVQREDFAAHPGSRHFGVGLVLTGRRKDGSEFPTEISLSPLQTEHGLMVCSAVRDVTERKKAEDAIRTLNAELEERVVARTAALTVAMEELKTAIEERRRLEEEVLEISEAERQRVGQDLHDDLGQQLAGLWFFAAALEKNLRAQSLPEADEAAEIAGMLDKALALTRSLARGLQPVMPDPGGLMAALAELAGRSSQLFKVRCRLACRRPVLVHDPAVATHLYRIAQEAVTNAVRHGHATHISIMLSSSPKELLLSVTDNGEGLAEPARKHDGMGMRTMNYRAEALGGSLAFRSRRGGGIRVICAIPKAAEPATRKDQHGKEKTNPSRPETK